MYMIVVNITLEIALTNEITPDKIFLLTDQDFPSFLPCSEPN